MHDTNLIVVRAFNTSAEVNIAKSALEAAGIESTIQADSAGGMRPHLAWASGGFKLLVREEDAMTAMAVLEPTSRSE